MKRSTIFALSILCLPYISAGQTGNVEPKYRFDLVDNVKNG